MNEDRKRLLNGLETNPALMKRFLSIPALANEPKSDGTIRSALWLGTQFLTYLRNNRKYGAMKTTLILRDDLVRRAKSRAALNGHALIPFTERAGLL